MAPFSFQRFSDTNARRDTNSVIDQKSCQEIVKWIIKAITPADSDAETQKSSSSLKPPSKRDAQFKMMFKPLLRRIIEGTKQERFQSLSNVLTRSILAATPDDELDDLVNGCIKCFPRRVRRALGGLYGRGKITSAHLDEIYKKLEKNDELHGVEQVIYNWYLANHDGTREEDIDIEKEGDDLAYTPEEHEEMQSSQIEARADEHLLDTSSLDDLLENDIRAPFFDEEDNSGVSSDAN